mmetsp:Transcript_57758/g.124907  ORF Transcript_57758/g.124907 Transcript_57758/m.124907 type:complete len:138 (-) Transcript_57758:51-464(-)
MPGEVVFAALESCDRMYFTVAGRLQYRLLSMSSRSSCGQLYAPKPGDYAKLVDVEAGTFLSELVLWTTWSHAGTLVATEICFFHYLMIEDFMKVIIAYPSGYVPCLLFARRVISHINMNTLALSDLDNRVDIQHLLT